jgi:hypothetical protein
MFLGNVVNGALGKIAIAILQLLVGSGKRQGNSCHVEEITLTFEVATSHDDPLSKIRYTSTLK